MEGEKSLKSVGSLKEGNYVVIDGVASVVSSIQISRPGKHGHAKVQLEARGLLDQKKRVTVMPGHDKIEVPIIDKRNAQVLSISGDSANVMDMETYETFDIDIPENLKGSCTEGAVVVYWVILSDMLMKQVKSSE